MQGVKHYLFIFLSLCFCAFLSACGSYGTSKSYTQDLISEAKSTIVLKPGGVEETGFLVPRPPLVKPDQKGLDILPIPGSKRMVKVKKSNKLAKIYQDAQGGGIASEDDSDLDIKAVNTNMIVKPYMLQANLAVPPQSYQIPASTAPIGDKGLSEANKEMIRRKDPNLTPSKKPLFSRK